MSNEDGDGAHSSELKAPSWLAPVGIASADRSSRPRKRRPRTRQLTRKAHCVRGDPRALNSTNRTAARLWHWRKRC